MYWTTRQTIEKRKVGELPCALNLEPDKDPEQIYQSFMSFLQKVIDDHYGFEEYNNDSLRCGSIRRMVPIPRKGTKNYWDIIEKEIRVDRDVSDVESDSEAWEDAPERPIAGQAIS